MTSIAAAAAAMAERVARQQSVLDPKIQDALDFWEGGMAGYSRVEQMRDLFTIHAESFAQAREAQTLTLKPWMDPEEQWDAALNRHPTWALVDGADNARFLARITSTDAACGVAFSRLCHLLGLPTATAVAYVAETGALHSLVEHNPSWMAAWPFLRSGRFNELSKDGRRDLGMHLTLRELTGSPFSPLYGFGWVESEEMGFVRAEAARTELGALSLGYKLERGWPADDYPVQQDTHRNPQFLINRLRDVSGKEDSWLEWDDALTLLARLAVAPSDALDLAAEQPEWNHAYLAQEHLGYLLRGACITARLICALLGMFGEKAREAALEYEQEAEPKDGA